MKYARILALIAAMFVLQAWIWYIAHQTSWWVFSLSITAGGVAWDVWRRWRR